MMQRPAYAGRALIRRCALPARLHLGDGFADAQAELSGGRLLRKGDDYAKTDVESAC